MGTSNFVIQVLRPSKTNSKLLGSIYLAFVVFIGLYSPITLSASSGDQFTAACVAGVESTGGRGSNAAAAYCGCMAKAASEFNGDSAGLLAVIEAPLESKVVVFRAQNDISKQIISACVTRVEEVYGIAENVAAKTTSENANQPQGIWADSDVTEAVQAINLSASQAKVFKASATKFSNDFRVAAEKIIRESLDTNRKLKKKQRVLIKRMDAEIMTVLESDQKVRYQDFSKLLANKMKTLGRDNSVGDTKRCMWMTNCG